MCDSNKTSFQFFKAKGKENFIVIERHHGLGYKTAKHYTSFNELNDDAPDSYDEFVSHIPSREIFKEFDDCSEWVELDGDDMVIVGHYMNLCASKGM